MSERIRLLTFTNLYPSAEKPRHGLFVRERTNRLCRALGASQVVLLPTPRVPRFLRRSIDRLHASIADTQVHEGVSIHKAPYFHVPGLSEAAQASRMVRGARPVFQELFDQAKQEGCRLVVDSHYCYPDAIAAIQLAEEFDVPCLATARGSDLNVLAKQPKVRAQLEEWLPRAFARIGVSQPLVEEFEELCPGLGRTFVARNGVDLERFHPGDPATARSELGLPADKALVCGVGRLVSGKGFLQMAKALHHLPSEVHFVVVGDGPERKVLEEASPKGRLHLLGARDPDQVARLYRASDLMVLPSLREGWPNVVTEALASGLRVVATPVGAIPEMLSNPMVGSLVRTADAKALAGEVERFLRSPSDPDQVARFAQRFSWDEPIQLLADTVREAIA